MTGRITRHRGIESLKTAARWPGADRNTTVTLAARLAADRADAEGYRYFCELAGAVAAAGALLAVLFLPAQPAQPAQPAHRNALHDAAPAQATAK